MRLIFTCFYVFLFVINFLFYLSSLEDVLIDFIVGDGREKERERNIYERDTHQLATLSMHPLWGLNPKPFGLPDDAQVTGPHWPGL